MKEKKLQLEPFFATCRKRTKWKGNGKINQWYGRPRNFQWMCDTKLVQTFCTIDRYGYVWNGHIMFINIEHRNLETRKTRNDFLVQVQNFLLPLSLKVLRHKERDTHSFYSGFFICPPSRATPAQGLREQTKVNRLLPRQFSTQLTDFFKIPKSSARFWCMTSFALASPVSHLGYCDISEWHVHSVCAWTPVLMLHLSNPCTEPKGSLPN